MGFYQEKLQEDHRRKRMNDAVWLLGLLIFAARNMSTGRILLTGILLSTAANSLPVQIFCRWRGQRNRSICFGFPKAKS